MAVPVSSTAKLLESVVNHLTLPPRLPGQQDIRLDKVEQCLIAFLLNATKQLESSADLGGLRRSLRTCQIANEGRKLHKPSLLMAFRELDATEFLILHVAGQNAALIVRRDHQESGQTVLFEAFEASPKSEDVLASKSALQWDFPGCAVAIPISEFNKPFFQLELATFLDKASTESIKRFAARTHKAGSNTSESRDSVDPSLVTQMLMTLLEVNGTQVFPELLRKRVRDDVCWDGAEIPWRRSAFWLVLRVAVQRHLSTVLGDEVGRMQYKFMICLVIAQLLDQSTPYLSPELLVHVRAKLCSRLVKLEVEREGATGRVRSRYEYMFETLRPTFLNSITLATERLDSDWAIFKKSIQRPVLTLPRRADQRHLYLTLPNSEAYLQQILTAHLPRQGGLQPSAMYSLSQNRNAFTLPKKLSTTFANRHFSLSRMEIEIEHDLQASPKANSPSEKECIRIADKIEKYLTTAAGAYDFNPEQKSIMILTVMELWISMDEAATTLFSLLKEYNPGFQPQILDVLQLSRFQDMCRLRKIQAYLQNRNAACEGSYRTVFDDPEKGCFAERYYEESNDQFKLQELHQHIETAAEQAKLRKEQEWREKCLAYENLVRKIADVSCFNIEDDFGFDVHDKGKCKKCFLEREERRLTIQAHEHPLPTDSIQAKTVVFEIGCPEALHVYRDTTWQIMTTLAFPSAMDGLEPHVLLQNYSELRPYTHSMKSRVSLASKKKSFLKTHYAKLRFPVDLTDVCLPNGLGFKSFDKLLKLWPGRQLQKTTFAHHCQIILPASSPFASLQLSPEFAVDTSGPSSYQVVASQTTCPSGLNVHEFMAFQALLSGKTRRWPQILMEIGSTNLNFGTESTTLLMGLLALQVGPSHADDPLGVVHRIFRDEEFCKRFLNQLDQRLDNISSNYRETNCMETIVTFMLRLSSIAGAVSSESRRLLEKVRTATFKWLTVLRLEVQTTTDADTSRRCSRYAFWSALLCRRTFAVHADRGELLKPSALQCFIECSIALQDNMAGDPATLPHILKSSLVRDLKMVYRMRSVIRRSLEASPESLISSLSMVWPDAEDSQSRTFSRLEFLDEPNEWWVRVTTDPTSQTIQQRVDFHLLEGHLLVMGKPIGKLPAEHRKSPVLQQLFGNQSFLTYPSSLPGMTYMLAIIVFGHKIHIGFRNGTLFVRAMIRNNIMELIPPDKFGNQQNFDLPFSLVTKCVHWLDLHTGKIEIRQQPNIWKSKTSNWILDVNNRYATRNKVTLVDPQSALFSRVARIFDKFEYRHCLTVFQPERGPLSVELRRLELSFLVNSRNLLESQQLQAEIIPDQDAGTWYGLNSKIVMKEVILNRNPHTQRSLHSEPGSQKSIIVPMGDVIYKNFGLHVIVDVCNNGDYGKYIINDVLKRLDCPAEPRLLYLKARFHAYTSFVLPDPLTGRTGTEESLHCLKSGYCQPWTPLIKSAQESLQLLARLTPHREYYPKDLKVMQRVQWDPHLTTYIQHDGFRAIVEDIRAKSEKLSMFATNVEEFPPFESGGENHLTIRSQLIRETYQRSNAGSSQQRPFVDAEYIARDRWRNSVGRLNVIDCTSLIRDWPSKVPSSLDVPKILQNWTNIGGYGLSFDKILLTDLLDVRFDSQWGALVNVCRNSTYEDAYRLMFLFGIMSFRQDADMAAVRTLISFALLKDLKVLQPPKWPNYIQFRYNHIPRIDYIVQFFKLCAIPYGGDERSAFGYALNPKQRRRLESAELAYEQQQEKDTKVLGEFLLEQWPCYEPTIEGFSTPVLIDATKALSVIRPEWQRLFQNWELSQHIAQVQSVLNPHCYEANKKPPNIDVGGQGVLPTRVRGGDFPTLTKNLLRKTIKNSQPVPTTAGMDTMILKGLNATNGLNQNSTGILRMSASTKYPAPQLAQETEELNRIIGSFENSESLTRQQYGNDLKQSLDALRKFKSTQVREELGIDSKRLCTALSVARQQVQENFDQLQKEFERDDSRVVWLQQGGLWPIITPSTLLENLRSISSCVFGRGIKESLISYAISITVLQLLIRLDDAQRKSNHQRVLEELQNVGHSNWDPRDRTDWLLLEIDANMLIRPIQVEVTLATISPSSGSNSVLQMNMGQGKTSCIMPMAAAILADGENLHRIMVPKSLLFQTAQLLQSRLGGLVGREICHVPFSRKTPTSPKTIKAFYDLHKNIRMASGIMLALPEHLLSFMLSGLQRLSDGRIDEAKTMIQVQDWMARKARDVLDECDSILAIRTQLIYPSGSQKTVDGHPHRWEIAEALLSRVDGHLWNLQKAYPQSIEVFRRVQGGFPVVFFLRKDVEDELIARLVDDIYRGRMPILPSNCRKAELVAIKQFISEAKVGTNIAESIHQIYPDKPAVRQAIYLLRGLFVYRILLMTLKKRWNVQYGLHPGRDPIAVPYMAKGCPSDQAEWGHPDVAIIFTCLAFYYDGLNISQLHQALEHVLKSDDPSQIYDRFSQDSNLPDSLREWNSINLDDEAQLKEIWQHVRYNVILIDYFLNCFVFPRHAKQFQMKLQASGWDIPLLSFGNPPKAPRTLEKRSNPLTTGFSGTNDWKRMLPLTINQRDLPGLAHTNAEVLTYLLQPRNRRYVLAADSYGRHIPETELLHRITNLKIRVLIDAGAQILEMTNYALAKAWLEIFWQAPAAVYFNEKNRPFVLYRKGHQIPLLASPFAEDLGECLVYLDEAHTRGTDLKFPADACGALTLGLGQSKDNTVQAAMRLRQLGTSQSVVFFAPPEVHQSMLDLCKTSGDMINSYHVICWLLEQTCSGIEQLQPLHFSQGSDFCRRSQAAINNQNFLTDSDHRKAYLKSLRQIEQQTLEKLYGVNAKLKSSTMVEKFSPIVATFLKELNTRRKGFQDTGSAVQGSALQEVEQEREVAYEVEAVREVQKPVHYRPLNFPGLHKDIVNYAKTGRLAADSTAWVEAFVALGNGTALGRQYTINSSATSRKLYISCQFTRTISSPLNRATDQFQRPVNWILFSTISDTALIVIPEEAEHLISLVGEAKHSLTHLLTYAAPITRKMLHFNDLKYYSMPSLPQDWESPMWLRIELGIFAGRLYFDHLEYGDLLRFLGVKEDSAKLEEAEIEDLSQQTDGTDDANEQEEANEQNRETKPFMRKPLSFLQEWLAIRRKGQDFAQTPMGFVCQGKPISESHPFFTRPETDGAEKKFTRVEKSGAAGTKDEDDEVEQDFYDDAYGVDVDEGEDGFDDSQLKDEDID